MMLSYNKINKEIEDYMVNYSRKNTHPGNIITNTQCYNNKSYFSIAKEKKNDYNTNIFTQNNNKPKQKQENKNKKIINKQSFFDQNKNDQKLEVHKLNKNNSLTNLHEDLPKRITSVDILTECIKKKDDLLTSLNHCNSRK